MRFAVVADRAARAWIEEHPGTARVIAYDVQRCCGGGKICRVSVRALGRHEDRDRFEPGTLDDGSTLMIDRRAAARLPSRFGLTVRGLGPLKHLDLDLDPEEWGALLYD